MKLKILSIAAILLLVAACSKPEEAGTGAGTGTEAGASGLPGGAGVSSSGLPGQSGAAAPGSQEDLEINVGDRVFFGYDSSVLDEAARQTLDRQAAWLNQYSRISVTIEGHCDERGTREYNLALGERRGSAARNYLAALGVATSRMRVISYGSERPQEPGQDENAYALNRRSVTVVGLLN